MGASAEEVEDVTASEGTEVSEGTACHREGFPSSCPKDGSIDDSGSIGMKENVSTCELSAVEDVVGTMNVSVLNSAAADPHGECGASAEQMVRRYPRDELEALRFADVDEQQKKWREVYHGLDSGVSQEYSEMAEDGQKKLNRNQEQPMRWERRKEPIGGKSKLTIPSILEYMLHFSFHTCSWVSDCMYADFHFGNKKRKNLVKKEEGNQHASIQCSKKVGD